MKLNVWCVIVISSLLVVLLQGCRQVNTGWPSYATESLWIPPIAQEVRREVFLGSYQVFYKAGVCFPATEFIRDMASAMGNKGWKRLVNDPLNPGRVLDHARDPDLQFGYFAYENRYRVYKWTEYWQDASGNIVAYTFTYMTRTADDVRKACTIDCFGSFVPVRVWQSTSRLYHLQ